MLLFVGRKSKKGFFTYSGKREVFCTFVFDLYFWCFFFACNFMYFFYLQIIQIKRLEAITIISKNFTLCF